jgi:hypothetical protein
MSVLERIPYPRRLAARVWLLTVPSALLSFERRQHVPRIPIGRGRLLGLLVIGAGVFLLSRGQGAASPPLERPHGLSRFMERPGVGGGLLALSGVGLLTRSLLLVAYVLALALAFAQDNVDLEEPHLPGSGPEGETPFEADETYI